MAGQYYIRIRGEVKGPLSQDQIVTQIRRKRLGRHHELSVDAVNWQKAGDMAELFEPVVAQREQVAVESETVLADVREQHQHVDAVEGGSATGSASTEWYYTKGGNKLGPVRASDIQMWLSTGSLSSSDLVWNEAFENWIPAGDLPQFSGVGGTRRKSNDGLDKLGQAGFLEILMGTSQAARMPSNAIHKFPNLTRYLRIAEASLRIIFVLAMFLSLAGSFYKIGLWVQLEIWELVAGGLMLVPIQLIFLWLLFITGMAVLELIRVIICIEDNTAAAV